ncbi:MAG: hypothetical protein LBQ83_01155 [Candidatus Margulisbacteria bacterium]|nr:hypothetical protein [Candidatus Margulisiibacteriota bacterium]
MVDSVGAVSSAGTQTSTSINSIKDLEENPEFFPLWVAEIQRRNMNLLLSSASYDADSSSDDGLSGLSSYYSTTSTGSADILSSLGLGSSTSDAMSSLFATQGITADFSFLTSSASLQSYQVAETLQGLQNYSNVTENQKWIGQLVDYLDPADGLLKTGRVTKIDIENVARPLFKIDDKTTVTLDDIKALSAEVSTDLAADQQAA